MKLSGVWLSVCLSIRPIIQPLQTVAASLLLWAVRAGDSDIAVVLGAQNPPAVQQQWHCSTALSSKCEWQRYSGY